MVQAANEVEEVAANEVAEAKEEKGKIILEEEEDFFNLFFICYI